MKQNINEEIRVLAFPENVRKRTSLYLADVSMEDASNLKGDSNWSWRYGHSRNKF